MARRSALRASDADRDFVAERLRDAAADGRIRPDELEHRLGVALSARTYGELDAIVADLPRDRAVAQPRRRQIRLHPAAVAALLILFPLAVALATALLVAVAMLVTAWAVVVTLAALVLGPRARAFGGPWAVGYRAWSRRYRHIDRSKAVAGFIPWL
jgi:uncharacterized membrane protein YcjF (UPF0283 family)